MSIVLIIVVVAAIGGAYLLLPTQQTRVEPEVEVQPLPPREEAPQPPRPQEPVPAPAPAAEPAPEKEEGEVEITIVGFLFKPDLLEIKVGTKVTWVMMDRLEAAGGEVDYHTAEAENREFSSPNLNYGNRWSFVFKDVGEFNYICAPHPYMKARIIVVP